MRKTDLLYIAGLLVASVGFAQPPVDYLQQRPLNSISLGLLGDASLISVQYERLFVVSRHLVISGKIGFGYNEEYYLFCFGPCGPPNRYLTIPHHITGNLGEGAHFLEFGIGGTLINGETTQPYMIYPIIGYRILPLKSGRLNFRIFGEIPFYGIEAEDILFIPGGFSLGISFQ